MANQIAGWALYEQLPKPELKFVLLALAIAASDDGWAVEPKVDTIASYTCMTPSQIKQAIDELVSLGWLQPVKPTPELFAVPEEVKGPCYRFSDPTRRVA